MIKDAIYELIGYKRLLDRLKELELDIKEAEERKNSVSSVIYYGGKPSGYINDRLSDYIAKLEQLKLDYIEEQELLLNKKKNIDIMFMQQLNTEERKLIKLKYIDKMKDYDIASKMNISVRTYYYMRNRALKKLCAFDGVDGGDSNKLC